MERNGKLRWVFSSNWIASFCNTDSCCGVTVLCIISDKSCMDNWTLLVFSKTICVTVCRAVLCNHKDNYLFWVKLLQQISVGCVLLFLLHLLTILHLSILFLVTEFFIFKLRLRSSNMLHTLLYPWRVQNVHNVYPTCWYPFYKAHHTYDGSKANIAQYFMTLGSQQLSNLH